MARKTTTRLQDDVEYVLYYSWKNNPHSEVYINSLVKQSNNWNIEAEDKIDNSLC